MNLPEFVQGLESKKGDELKSKLLKGVYIGGLCRGVLQGSIIGILGIVISPNSCW